MILPSAVIAWFFWFWTQKNVLISDISSVIFCVSNCCILHESKDGFFIFTYISFFKYLFVFVIFFSLLKKCNQKREKNRNEKIKCWQKNSHTMKISLLRLLKMFKNKKNMLENQSFVFWLILPFLVQSYKSFFFHTSIKSFRTCFVTSIDRDFSLCCLCFSIPFVHIVDRILDLPFFGSKLNRIFGF